MSRSLRESERDHGILHVYDTHQVRDEQELSRILHEDVPLVADMAKAEVNRLRKNGLHLHCAFEW